MLKTLSRFFLIVLLFLLIGTLSINIANAVAPIPTYLSTKIAGGTGSDYSYAIHVDSSENTYLGGGFNSSGNFAADWGGSDTVTATSDAAFLTKVNSNGTYAWTRTFDGDGDEYIYTIDSNSSDDVYVGGTYTDVVDFGASWSESDVKSNSGDNDIFISKINSDGTYGWTKVIGSTQSDTVTSIDTDSSGNIYACGQFADSINFAADWGGSDIIASEGFEDGFVTKINANGTYGWTRTFGSSSGNERCTSINVDINNNIYLSGDFPFAVNFGASWSINDTKTPSLSDPFLMKINNDGSYGWTKYFSSSAFDFGQDVYSDSLGNVYILSIVSDAVNFAADWGGTDPKASTSETVALTKVNSDGTYGWTRIIDNNSQVNADSIITDSINNIYISGIYDENTDFATDWGQSDPIIHTGSFTNLFITAVNSDGTYGWTRTVQSDSASPTDLSISPTGKLVLGGYFSASANFASGFSGTDNKTAVSSEDAFIMQVSVSATATSITNLNSQLNAIDVLSTTSAETPSSVFMSTTTRSIRLEKADSTPLAIATVGLQEDRNWSTVSADSDISSGKSFVHNLSSAPGVSGTYTLYVPKLAGNTQVLICPSATSFDQVISNCSGGYVKKTGDAGLSVQNVSGQDYWVIVGVSGSGGLSGGTMGTLSDTGMNLLPVMLIAGSIGAIIIYKKTKLKK